MQTLHVCGDWAATDDAVLDMSTDAVWVQGRAARKRISALQARRLRSSMPTVRCHRCQLSGTWMRRACIGWQDPCWLCWPLPVHADCMVEHAVKLCAPSP